MKRAMCGVAIALLLTGCEYVGYLVDGYEKAQILGVECPKQVQSGSQISHLIAWVYQPGGSYGMHSVVAHSTFQVEKENQHLVLTGLNRKAAPVLGGLPASYDYPCIQKVNIPVILPSGTYSVSIPKEYYIALESPLIIVKQQYGDAYFFQKTPPFNGEIDYEKQLFKFSLATPSYGIWPISQDTTIKLPPITFFMKESSGSFEFPIEVSPHSDTETLVVN